MNVFVTGGAGFIGSHLVDALIDKGNSVTVFDDLSSGKKEFIEHHLNSNNFTFIEADLIHFETISQAIKDHDVVFHIAANPDVRMGAQKPDIAKKDILATYNLLDAMRENNIKKIVFSSSSVIYGETPSFPLPELWPTSSNICLWGSQTCG